jgi:hypothetical protein
VLWLGLNKLQQLPEAQSSDVSKTLKEAITQILMSGECSDFCVSNLLFHS